MEHRAPNFQYNRYAETSYGLQKYILVIMWSGFNHIQIALASKRVIATLGK